MTESEYFFKIGQEDRNLLPQEEEEKIQTLVGALAGYSLGQDKNSETTADRNLKKAIKDMWGSETEVLDHAFVYIKYNHRLLLLADEQLKPDSHLSLAMIGAQTLDSELKIEEARRKISYNPVLRSLVKDEPNWFTSTHRLDSSEIPPEIRGCIYDVNSINLYDILRAHESKMTKGERFKPDNLRHLINFFSSLVEKEKTSGSSNQTIMYLFEFGLCPRSYSDQLSEIKLGNDQVCQSKQIFKMMKTFWVQTLERIQDEDHPDYDLANDFVELTKKQTLQQGYFEDEERFYSGLVAIQMSTLLLSKIKSQGNDSPKSMLVRIYQDFMDGAEPEQNRYKIAQAMRNDLRTIPMSQIIMESSDVSTVPFGKYISPMDSVSIETFIEVLQEISEQDPTREIIDIFLDESGQFQDDDRPLGVKMFFLNEGKILINILTGKSFREIVELKKNDTPDKSLVNQNLRILLTIDSENNKLYTSFPDLFDPENIEQHEIEQILSLVNQTIEKHKSREKAEAPDSEGEAIKEFRKLMVHPQKPKGPERKPGKKRKKTRQKQNDIDSANEPIELQDRRTIDISTIDDKQMKGFDQKTQRMIIQAIDNFNIGHDKKFKELSHEEAVVLYRDGDSVKKEKEKLYSIRVNRQIRVYLTADPDRENFFSVYEVIRKQS